MSTNHAGLSPTGLSVGELVRQRADRARVFERLGIDYCCGGGRSLTEVCAERNLDVEAVLRELDKVDQEPRTGLNFSSLGLTELADHIEKVHHAYLKQELPRLEFLTRKVADAHERHHPQLHQLREVYRSFASDLLDHMRKEERVVFPLCRRLDRGEIPVIDSGCSLSTAIDVLSDEHSQAGHALEIFRRLTDGYAAPPDACNTYRAMLDSLSRLEADMRQHVHLENNVLFPAALAAVRALPKDQALGNIPSNSCLQI